MIYFCGIFRKREIEELFKTRVYRQERWLSYAKKRLINSNRQREQMWRQTRLGCCSGFVFLSLPFVFL
jgi:hypothetical protein